MIIALTFLALWTITLPFLGLKFTLIESLFICTGYLIFSISFICNYLNKILNVLKNK